MVNQMIQELESVALAEDIPELKLKKGDVGTVVLVHKNGEGYEVEFVTLGGETIVVTTLFAEEVRRVGEMDSDAK
jgi:hypothetical protein